MIGNIMNLLLLDENVQHQSLIRLSNERQIKHLHQILKAEVNDVIKLGIRQGQRFLGKIVTLDTQMAEIQILHEPSFDVNPPKKLPVTLVLALPRPKVLRRMIQDATAMGVQKIVLLHSYHVDKSYWSSPIVQALDEAVVLGLEQAQDTIAPEIVFEKRFKPFVEDRLSTWIHEQNPAYVAHPYAQSMMPAQIQHDCILVIGCERGFIPYEIELLKQNGCEIYQLGSRILRTENSVPYCLGRLFNC